MDAILTEIGPVNAIAGAAIGFGVLMLILALRALTNAALLLRARLFALGSALTLLSTSTFYGGRHPAGLDAPWTETLFAMVTEALARWMGSPVETAAVVAGLVLVGGLILWLILVYYWIRALMRMAWVAFVGLCLLALSLSVVLAAEGVLPVPDLLRDSFVLAAIVSMLLIVWGVVRLLRRATTSVPKK